MITARPRNLEFGERGIVQVVPDAEALAHLAAEIVCVTAAAAVQERGDGYVALSGGTTPKRMGTLLASDTFRDKLQWDRVHWFWGDERWVPLESEECNAGEAIRAFLHAVPVPPINVQPVITKGEPEVAAANYEALIRQKLANGDPPVFDLILLGMGTDGHTASLFPGTAAIHERRRLVVAYRVEQVNAVRLTFTPPLINAARSVIFLVSGESKAERLREVLTGPYDPDRLPAQVVRPTTGTLQWLVDEAAASRLPG